jgi:5-methylcytosine-specific restriction endonuclease McrA
MKEIKERIKQWKEEKKREDLTKKVKIAFELEIKETLPQKCKCGRTENLTLDHIIPQNILKDLGVDIEREIIEDNYQILCRTCNQFKSNRLDFSEPKTKEILIRLLQKL